jgi:hypothetical protein
MSSASDQESVTEQQNGTSNDDSNSPPKKPKLEENGQNHRTKAVVATGTVTNGSSSGGGNKLNNKEEESQSEGRTSITKTNKSTDNADGNVKGKGDDGGAVTLVGSKTLEDTEVLDKLKQSWKTNQVVNGKWLGTYESSLVLQLYIHRESPVWSKREVLGCCR